jgi:uncharacterized protein YbjT (DUF2867 family)
MILVTGATGRLGGAVVGQLLERIDAADIAILARDPAKAGDLAGRGVSVRTGDYDDTASLARAMDGVDLPEAVARRTLGFFTDMRDGQLNQTSSDLVTLLGREPAGLTEGLREVFALTQPF